MVKPSPKPFDIVVNQLDIKKKDCIVVGDSPRRDLGGALAANLDCILVGGEKDSRAVAHLDSLLTFSKNAHLYAINPLRQASPGPSFLVS